MNSALDTYKKQNFMFTYNLVDIPPSSMLQNTIKLDNFYDLLAT